MKYRAKKTVNRISVIAVNIIPKIKPAFAKPLLKPDSLDFFKPIADKIKPATGIATVYDITKQAMDKQKPTIPRILPGSFLGG